MTVLLLTLISVSLIYYILSTCLVASFFREGKSSEEAVLQFPPVSIVKPIAGVESHYLDFFSSFCRQEYPNYEVIFCLTGRDDQAVSIIEELKTKFPELEIRWVLADGLRGPNYKVNNLIGAINASRYEIVVMSDSDMIVGPTYLKDVVEAFLEEGTGVVTCLYRGVHLGNIPSALQALSIQGDFLPNVVLDNQFEGISYGFGATICTSKSILNSVGGLEPIRDYLADDYQIGNRIHGQGYRVCLSKHLVDHASSIRTFKDLFQLNLRWAVTQRVSRPLGYAASIITHGTLLSTLYLVLHHFSLPAISLFLFMIAVRIACFAHLNSTVIHNGEVNRYIWLIPVKDLFGSLVWLLSLFTDVVHWRKRRFKVLKGGKMIEEC